MNDSMFWVIVAVVALVCWVSYGNSRDKEKALEANRVLVRELERDRQYTDGRVVDEFDPTVYSYPLLQAPWNTGFFAPVMEGWQYSEHDPANASREVENRFPTWMFLIREPKNRYNWNAIAVYSLNHVGSGDVYREYRGNRQIGYLDASDAQDFAPVLDRFPLTRVAMRIHHVEDGYRPFYSTWTSHSLEQQLTEFYELGNN
ncbi:hypothetical protein E3T39_00900 [Cryobacterium suzukii]|uniref:HIRAN domain-containing protein n=1 Tax=Cryobacterium suzukii TaxID=1259198 RepID=A0A4R9AHZ6_9MICO|nr:HIRAN domain-containing protein [Cryobacterium suzukii]TFD62543.1 hypothetical protein E3T39_00900 [Cryobacterium suzukii]